MEQHGVLVKFETTVEDWAELELKDTVLCSAQVVLERGFSVGVEVEVEPDTIAEEELVSVLLEVILMIKVYDNYILLKNVIVTF